MTSENKTSTQQARKSLEKNYSKLSVNVRKDTYEIWKQYAASKGLSMYALVNQLFDEAIEKDGFIPEKPTSEE